MSKPTPLMILSDSPDCTSGLGRITRDLATRIHQHMPDVFRVATLGYGGPGSKDLSFPQYHIHDVTTWLVPEIMPSWDDFAGSERGVVLTIWDASRLKWFARPDFCQIPQLTQWLQSAPFERWGYWPIDATGPNDKLSGDVGLTIAQYDRVLAYSEWAAGILRRTLPSRPAGSITSLPHGLDGAVWNPKPKAEARVKFREMGATGVSDSALLIGVVATNQARKDFGLAFDVCRLLLAEGKDVRLWIHTDALKRYWDIVALAQDFGLVGRVLITTSRFSDEQMGWMYAACDVTLGIGLGEGFGYPIFESLASGTHVVSGDYGGADEFLSAWGTETAETYRWEGQFNNLRPVYRPMGWAVAAKMAENRQNPAKLPDELEWSKLWPRWERWLREGVGR